MRHLSLWSLHPLPSLFLIAAVGLLCPLLANARVYDVGPGQAHADLSSIDWPGLQEGDEVRIHWREQPYRSKIGLRSRGTAAAPIRILGVAGPNGERPVISGDQATTPASLVGFFEREYTEPLGIIVIHRGPDDDWGYKPGHIQIRGLKLEGAHPNRAMGSDTI